MNFSRGRARREGVEISMIPLVDMFLTILVFFLVSTSFQRESSFFVELPESKTGVGVSKDTKQIYITIGTDGALAVNREKVSSTELPAALERIEEARRGNVPVVVRADKSVAHGTVVGILDVVRDKGFAKVGMATQVPAGQVR